MSTQATFMMPLPFDKVAVSSKAADSDKVFAFDRVAVSNEVADFVRTSRLESYGISVI